MAESNRRKRNTSCAAIYRGTSGIEVFPEGWKPCSNCKYSIDHAYAPRMCQREEAENDTLRKSLEAKGEWKATQEKLPTPQPTPPTTPPITPPIVPPQQQPELPGKFWEKFEGLVQVLESVEKRLGALEEKYITLQEEVQRCKRPHPDQPEQPKQKALKNMLGAYLKDMSKLQ